MKTVLSQILGLVLFFGLVAVLTAGRLLIRRARRDRLWRAAGRPVPGRITAADAEEIARTDEWMSEMHRDAPSHQPHDPGELRPACPVPPASGRAS